MGLVVLLGLNVVLAAVAVVVRLSEVGLLQRIGRGELVTTEEASRSDQRVAVVTITGIVVLVVTGVVWLVWQHRSQANLHAARLRELQYTPGWAVGWWLIPLASLVKPFQTVRELWKASGGDEHWWQTTTWPLIGWWWAAWISGFVLDRVASVVVDSASTLDTLIFGSRLFLGSEVVTIVAGILALAIVRSVNGRQEMLRARPVEGEVPPPRPDVTDLSS
jgi:heme/copper-type cytochrome/quinol oxidase subunit 2